MPCRVSHMLLDGKEQIREIPKMGKVPKKSGMTKAPTKDKEGQIVMDTPKQEAQAFDPDRSVLAR